MAKRDGNEFTRKIKAQGFERSKRIDGKPRCDGCQCELVPGQITYDHIKTVEEGGEGTLANCQVLCRTCDRVKTYSEDIPRIRKGDRQRDGHSGALQSKPTGLTGRDRAAIDADKAARGKARQGPGKLPVPGPKALFVGRA